MRAGVLAADKDSGASGLRDVRALSDTSERIQRLARRVRGFPPREICFERARLMTESYRRTAGEPAIVRKAQAFYAVADGLPLQIEPGEWLVGNIASRPRVAYFAPESYDWSQFKPGTEQVLKSDLVRGQDIRFRIPEDIAAFWRAMPPGDTAGHFVADYGKVLRQGWAGLRAEVEQCREQHRRAGTLDAQRSAFYEAAQIACRAAERFTQRHAEEARSLAARIGSGTLRGVAASGGHLPACGLPARGRVS